jgi:hypothetical protein
VSPVKEVEIIKKARERIADPKRWTTGAFARDKDGNPVPVFDGKAVCWCVSGALAHIAGYSDGYDAEKLLMPGGVAGYNDAHSHAEVLELLDKTIARLEER